MDGILKDKLRAATLESEPASTLSNQVQEQTLCGWTGYQGTSEGSYGLQEDCDSGTNPVDHQWVDPLNSAGGTCTKEAGLVGGGGNAIHVAGCTAQDWWCTAQERLQRLQSSQLAEALGLLAVGGADKASVLEDRVGGLERDEGHLSLQQDVSGGSPIVLDDAKYLPFRIDCQPEGGGERDLLGGMCRGEKRRKESMGCLVVLPLSHGDFTEGGVGPHRPSCVSEQEPCQSKRQRFRGLVPSMSKCPELNGRDPGYFGSATVQHKAY